MKTWNLSPATATTNARWTSSLVDFGTTDKRGRNCGAFAVILPPNASFCDKESFKVITQNTRNGKPFGPATGSNVRCMTLEAAMYEASEKMERAAARSR